VMAWLWSCSPNHYKDGPFSFLLKLFCFPTSCDVLFSVASSQLLLFMACKRCLISVCKLFERNGPVI
jgi:hypothetical protein